MDSRCRRRRCRHRRRSRRWRRRPRRRRQRGFRHAQGERKGEIARSMRGENGFGWDVIFIPEHHEKTYAEMNFNEKNAISHRRLAFEKLNRKIKK